MMNKYIGAIRPAQTHYQCLLRNTELLISYEFYVAGHLRHGQNNGNDTFGNVTFEFPLNIPKIVSKK